MGELRSPKPPRCRKAAKWKLPPGVLERRKSRTAAHNKGQKLSCAKAENFGEKANSIRHKIPACASTLFFLALIQRPESSIYRLYSKTSPKSGEVPVYSSVKTAQSRYSRPRRRRSRGLLPRRYTATYGSRSTGWAGGHTRRTTYHSPSTAPGRKIHTPDAY